ncbi:MAG: hypothetical protein U5O39_15915 [Gammaproteobacteria bacterium]|nr:hypothetical protein [Gammaproteobacteria bacterium]
MLDGFDEANARAPEAERMAGIVRPLVGTEATLLLSSTLDRWGSRILHVLGLASIEDHFAAVTQDQTSLMTPDKTRVEDLLAFMDKDPQTPFFAFVHLNGYPRTSF